MRKYLYKLLVIIRDFGIVILKLFKFGTSESKLMVGKIRRTIKNYLLPKKIRDKKLSARSGKCKQCGACCQLGFTCLHLDEETKNCKIYDIRSHSCRIYPLDEKELRDRDLVDKTTNCGFYFDK